MSFGKLLGPAAVSVMAAVCLQAAALTPQQEGAAALTPDVEAGADLYQAECRGCHAVSIAPTLRGVLNRPIAGVESFMGYSEGLKAKKGQTWTHANLEAFLKAPSEFASGTHMVKAIPDAQTRADIIAYIETLPPPR